MSITFIKKIVEHKTENSRVPAKPNTNYMETKCANMFFVIGRATSGERFYSETVNDYNKAYKMFDLYKSMIDYFGGGEVELVCVYSDGYDILEIARI